MLCPRCERDLAEENFGWRTSERLRRKAYCKDCTRAYANDHYQKNRVKRLEQISSANKKTRLANLDRLSEYKAEQSCADCNERNPVVLEFDHLRDKVECVSIMARNGYRWDRILAEMGKCEVVCANCHRKRTHSRRLASLV